MSFLAGLNPTQLQAVTLPNQSALVVAGAGSGKTRVLTTRIAWLLQNDHARPANILAVTFTNKAAQEMLSRVNTLLTVSSRQLWVGTFHSLSNRLLRIHHKEAQLPAGFLILDSNDQQSMIKRVLKAFNINEEKYPPRSVVYYINSAKEQGLRAAQVEVQDSYHDTLRTIYQEYETVCQKEGVVDFAELLLRCVELLQRTPMLREHYQQRFRHILIDEFQDTNDLQYNWLKLFALSATPAAVFAVGDDDQSIYAFRGAKVAHMRTFTQDFAVPHLIKLEHNYRSSGHILDSANALIANNSGRLGKNLFTEDGAGEPLRIMECDSDSSESEWLVEQVAAMQAEGVEPHQIAVLYRANAQSRAFEHALVRGGYAYRVYGGLRFYDRAEIKNALAYLQLMLRRENDNAFLRVVNFPPRGIGARTVEQLQDTAGSANSSLYGAIAYINKAPLQQFSRLLENIYHAGGDLSFGDWVAIVLRDSGLFDHYKNEKDGADRVENLHQLITAAILFAEEWQRDQDNNPADNIIADTVVADLAPELVSEQNTPNLSDIFLPPNSGVVQNVVSAAAPPPSPLLAKNIWMLQDFLANASLESSEQQAEVGVSAVQLMTIHAAKGLEFDVVFITGLEEGMFPHENSMGEEGGMEEERRLMYVAITRARKKLFLSYAQYRQIHGRAKYGLRSRFIDEIPEQHTKWLSADRRKKEAWWSAGEEHGKNPLEGFKVLGNTNNQAGFVLGQQVYHQTFGNGVITDFPAPMQARIQFNQYGSKLLDLTVAKLQAV